VSQALTQNREKHEKIRATVSQKKRELENKMAVREREKRMLTKGETPIQREVEGEEKGRNLRSGVIVRIRGLFSAIKKTESERGGRAMLHRGDRRREDCELGLSGAQAPGSERERGALLVRGGNTKKGKITSKERKEAEKSTREGIVRLGEPVYKNISLKEGKIYNLSRRSSVKRLSKQENDSTDARTA